MLFGIATKKDDDWWIGVTNPDTPHLSKYESLMFQGNGYLGIRGSLEEHYLNEKRDMFILGTFDKFKKEATELPNLPDIVNIEITVNGKSLSLNHGETTNYQRGLNLKNGEIIRAFDWKKGPDKLHFEFRRFVSMANCHLFVSEVKITPISDTVRLQIKSGIDGQQTNGGTQHFIEGNKRLFNARFVQMQTQTQNSLVKFALTEYHRLFLNETELTLNPRLQIERRQVFANYSIDVEKDQCLTFVKYANVFCSSDKDLKDNVSEDCLHQLEHVGRETYQKLLANSTKAWAEKIWNNSCVEISSHNNKPQIAVNYAQYQLVANVPCDYSKNIGAKGMTGEGYKGHAFWDTEIFMMPFFRLNIPSYAHNLLIYRYLNLIGAQKKAHQGGYKGAQYPWEAAMPEDAESAPLWGSADIITGEPMKILSGSTEIHVTSDVAFGVYQYIKNTGDYAFAKRMGYEIILQCAQFWASRVTWNSVKNSFEILDVIGPDEYKEHADNNAFTNYMAHWCMRKGAEVITDLRQNDLLTYNHLNKKFNLKQLVKELIEKASMMYLPEPNGDGIIPQDDNYLSYKKINVNKYRMSDSTSEIFKDFDLKQLDKIQVTKQADVLLLLLLFEGNFSKKIIKKNWDYYEPKTIHDSSLSFSTHAILANDIGLYGKAFDYFEKNCQIDLGTNMNSSVKGVHMAGLAGTWKIVIEGFGGVRLVKDGLQIQPHIPSTWKSLKYSFVWKGIKINVLVTHGCFSVVADGKIKFISHKHVYYAEPDEKILIETKV
ncbi:glycosyl hydrolase family 65 protein [Companilactobacillus huachuanensis]|uniref:Glycosyl hydrolase family 65 protein n=1 Tax=Companilactobacillus huachuanensis TaxID=2559914 RepID=A0ABW1RQM2_9LACO|nr:glycosyl hydrolase family 65 protein [Companilactobacillus huachuanensis]